MRSSFIRRGAVLATGVLLSILALAGASTTVSSAPGPAQATKISGSTSGGAQLGVTNTTTATASYAVEGTVPNASTGAAGVYGYSSKAATSKTAAALSAPHGVLGKSLTASSSGPQVNGARVASLVGGLAALGAGTSLATSALGVAPVIPSRVREPPR